MDDNICQKNFKCRDCIMNTCSVRDIEDTLKNGKCDDFIPKDMKGLPMDEIRDYYNKIDAKLITMKNMVVKLDDIASSIVSGEIISLPDNFYLYVHAHDGDTFFIHHIEKMPFKTNENDSESHMMLFNKEGLIIDKDENGDDVVTYRSIMYPMRYSEILFPSARECDEETWNMYYNKVKK